MLFMALAKFQIRDNGILKPLSPLNMGTLGTGLRVNEIESLRPPFSIACIDLDSSHPSFFSPPNRRSRKQPLEAIARPRLRWKQSRSRKQPRSRKQSRSWKQSPASKSEEAHASTRPTTTTILMLLHLLSKLLNLSPFSLDDFENAICHKESNILLIVES
ncbi:hypothetical protein LXL04_005244 [Taraxacum kok-saghyz]